MKRVVSVQESYAGKPRGTVFEIENDADADAMIHAGWVQETTEELTVEEEQAPDLEGLSVDELKDMARDKGLPVSGTKAIDRLSEEE